jgi:hypothetical protein
VDNCPFLFNPSQKDTDSDGIGDDCDADADGDGVFAGPGGGGGSLPDNCPGVYNPDQKDANANGKGAACDPTEDDDFDDDGVKNALDNCLLDANADQADVDDSWTSGGDGEGGACDPDTDGDGWSNDDDNCPFTQNRQADSDGDGAGDACDKCAGVADVTAWTAGIPELGIPPKPVQPDFDEDGIPDACDSGFKTSGEFLRLLKPDGRARNVDVERRSGSYLRVALAPCLNEDECPEWFGQDERRVLSLRGMPRHVKTWITDESGRAVAKPKIRDGDERLLRFRPVAGHKYSLFLYFSNPPAREQHERFSATMSVARADVQPPPPRPRNLRSSPP